MSDRPDMAKRGRRRRTTHFLSQSLEEIVDEGVDDGPGLAGELHVGLDLWAG